MSLKYDSKVFKNKPNSQKDGIFEKEKIRFYEPRL